MESNHKERHEFYGDLIGATIEYVVIDDDLYSTDNGFQGFIIKRSDGLQLEVKLVTEGYIEGECYIDTDYISTERISELKSKWK